MRALFLLFAVALLPAPMAGQDSTQAAAPPATPTSGGTQILQPGMSEAQVMAAWGSPVAVRKSGNFTYMFYMNDCLRACGTYDLVILQGGQTVDAIARASYHRYDGVSSSPNDRMPEYTPPAADSTPPPSP